jgi:hypothetical protein
MSNEFQTEATILKLQPGDMVGRWRLKQRVISISPPSKRLVHWRALCACNGVEHLVAENSIRRGSSLSCGCWNREMHQLDPVSDLAALRLKYRAYKNRAHRKGRTFTLTFDHFGVLVRGNCHYCSKPPIKLVGRRRKDGDFATQNWPTLII